METFLGIALIAFLPLIVHLIVSGFKKSITWGLANLFLGVFTMPFFYFIHRQDSPIISGLSIIVYTVIVAGLFFESSFLFSSIIILSGVFICFYIIISEMDLIGNLRLSISSKKLKIGGYEFEKNTLSNIRKNYKNHLKSLSGKSSLSYLMEFWGREDFINDVFSYINKYMIYIYETNSSSLINSFHDERFEYFKKMMIKKYNISSCAITITILFFREELSYINYVQSLDILPDDNSKDILEKLVYYDIEKRNVSPDEWIVRLMKEHNFEKKIIKKRSNYYRKIKEKVKLSYFEHTFQEDETVFGALDHEIRNKKLREKISELEFKIREEIESIVSIDLDLDVDNYIIHPEDYSRASRIDAFYRSKFSTLLSRAFDGHCCKCGGGMIQLEFDHFWLPKSKGGNFLMRHVNGYYVNNCIPLCGSCNSSKGKKEIYMFFKENDKKEIEDIVKRSQSINAELNFLAGDFSDPYFTNRIY